MAILLSKVLKNYYSTSLFNMTYFDGKIFLGIPNCVLSMFVEHVHFQTNHLTLMCSKNGDCETFSDEKLAQNAININTANEVERYQKDIYLK